MHINQLISLHPKKQHKLSSSGAAVSTQSSHPVFLAKAQLGNWVSAKSLNEASSDRASTLCPGPAHHSTVVPVRVSYVLPLSIWITASYIWYLVLSVQKSQTFDSRDHSPLFLQLLSFYYTLRTPVGWRKFWVGVWVWVRVWVYHTDFMSGLSSFHAYPNRTYNCN